MREDDINKIEVHVAGICFKDDTVLTAKRSPARGLFPNKWECGGGQVKMNEDYEDAVIRQFKEEFKILVKPVKVLCTYTIETPNSDQKKIPGLRIICEIFE